MIPSHPTPARLLYGSDEIDLDLIMRPYFHGDVDTAWNHFGMTKSAPITIIRGSNYVFLFEVTGPLEALRKVGISEPFSLAILQIVDDEIHIVLARVTIDDMTIHSSMTDFNGRVDFRLLSEPRVL